MISGPLLEQEVFSYWGKRFNCPPQDFGAVGSLILAEEDFRDTSHVTIYHLGDRSVVRLDPALCVPLHISNRQVLASSISQPDLAIILKLGMRHTVTLEVEGHGSYFYLDPLHFKPCLVDRPGRLCQLDPRSDREMIAALCQACTPREVDDAELYEDQPDALIYGHVLAGQLVSYAGFRYWEARFADIGVLTHPGQRGLGLARAATSHLCDWCLERDVIPMYRVEDSNLASHKIPIALGFTKMVDIEILKVVV